MVQQDEAGDRRLIAYIVPDQSRVTSIPASFSRQKLPKLRYLPFCSLAETLPANFSSKINRQALPPWPKVELQPILRYHDHQLEVELIMQIWAAFRTTSKA